MCLNKNYHAKSNVPANCFKHIHSRSNHETKGPLWIVYTKLAFKQISQPGWQQNQKNEKVVFQVDLPENVYILC